MRTDLPPLPAPDGFLDQSLGGFPAYTAEQMQAYASQARGALVEALQACLAMLERADCSTGYCCCGSAVDGHGIGDGHGPVDEGDYHQHKAIESARAALALCTPQPADAEGAGPTT